MDFNQTNTALMHLQQMKNEMKGQREALEQIAKLLEKLVEVEVRRP